jgi:acyl-[acyl-carrier-protein]-phospholipid O-acyltransferase/long-chain-fatty-acid--[acyl-carrier-protein] ligase
MVAGLWFVGLAFGLPAEQRAAVTAAVMLVAAMSFAAVRFIPRGAPAAVPGAVDWNVFKGTWRTLREAATEPMLIKPILLLGWSWFVASLALSTAPALVARSGGSSAEMSWLMIAYGMSGAVAAQLVARACRVTSPSAITAVAFVGQALAAAAIWISASGSSQQTVLVAAICFLAIFHSMILIPNASLIQTKPKAERRARSAAASNIVNALFMVVGGFGAAGIQALGVDLAVIYAAAGLISACATVIAART